MIAFVSTKVIVDIAITVVERSQQTQARMGSAWPI
jgi:hypothetical protein